MILSQSETLGEAKVLDGLERWHHDILQLICLEGEAELRELPLRHFAPLFICASSLPQEAQIWMPPTVRMPMHNTITAPELQNLLKYSSNFPAYLISIVPQCNFNSRYIFPFDFDIDSQPNWSAGIERLFISSFKYFLLTPFLVFKIYEAWFDLHFKLCFFHYIYPV